MEENIKRVITKYRKIIPEKIIKRDVKVHKLELDKAIVIVGPRKSGKTYFMYSLLKKEQAPIFINFEDNLLTELTNKDLNKIVDFSKELFEERPINFYFDEIQSITDWERFVVSLLNEHYQVTITGSNSRLLSKEIATSLRGKSLTYLMLPFSFSEFLDAKALKIDENFEYTDQVFKIKKQFQSFFKYGGFPEIVLSDSVAIKNKLINNYFESVLYKDLVDRLNLKNIKLVDITIKYLLNLFSNIFSISAFERYLKSNKIPYSLEDLYMILKSLQDVFMFCFVKEYSKSFKKAEISKSKIYVFDTAYIHFLANEPNDYGRILENIVFTELFRRVGEVENRKIYYYISKNNLECDFVLLDKEKAKLVIQVSYKVDEGNRKREVEGLLAAMNFFNKKNGLILTYDQEDEFKIGNKKIILCPVWKWLLNEKS